MNMIKLLKKSLLITGGATLSHQYSNSENTTQTNNNSHLIFGWARPFALPGCKLI
jgi:hypothetical protein